MTSKGRDTKLAKLKGKKFGPLEDMTVHLLKQVLDDLNITYRSSE